MPLPVNMSALRGTSRDELRALTDAAGEAVMAKSREMIAEDRARKPDPRSPLTYKTYRTMGMVAVVVVRHADRGATLQVSRNGDAKGKHAFPRAAWLTIQPESAGPFLLALVSKRNLAWILEKQEVNLGGVVPELVGDWSDEDRKTWSDLKHAADHINVRIRAAGKRSSIMTRNQAA